MFDLVSNQMSKRVNNFMLNFHEETEKCEDCKGTGEKDNEECPECEGRGEKFRRW